MHNKIAEAISNNICTHTSCIECPLQNPNATGAGQCLGCKLNDMMFDIEAKESVKEDVDKCDNN